MTFAHTLSHWSPARIEREIERSTSADVRRAVSCDHRSVRDLAALLSPAAGDFLEDMAREAQRLTRMHFGRTIGLYVPLYVSNLCAADCVYCSYASHSGARERRRTLTDDEIAVECDALREQGFRNVLLLSGEAPTSVPVDHIARAVRIAAERFPAVGAEIYSLDEAGYATLAGAGLESVTLYQETYDRDTYRCVHPSGQKADYDFRLGALERAGRAGVRRLSLGALLGLSSWRADGFATAMHARYLQKACWQSAVSVSFPRLRKVPDRFAIAQPVHDRELVQLMLAMRLFVPEAGFNLSTREPASLRDRLIPLGVTMMSAGSSTRPGGYATSGEETLAQFDISDTRSPDEVIAAIRRAGYDPVHKDFDAAFLGPGGPASLAETERLST